VQPGVIVSASCIAFMRRRAYPYPDLHDCANLFRCTECKVQICEHAARSVDRGRRLDSAVGSARNLLPVLFQLQQRLQQLGSGARIWYLALLDGISVLIGPSTRRTSAGTQGKIGP
jgi:hypothetical protein